MDGWMDGHSMDGEMRDKRIDKNLHNTRDVAAPKRDADWPTGISDFDRATGFTNIDRIKIVYPLAQDRSRRSRTSTVKPHFALVIVIG